VKNPLEKGRINIGVKGMFPLGCLPLWGREGVILTIGKEYKRIIGENRISTEQKNQYYLIRFEEYRIVLNRLQKCP